MKHVRGVDQHSEPVTQRVEARAALYDVLDELEASRSLVRILYEVAGVMLLLVIVISLLGFYSIWDSFANRALCLVGAIAAGFTAGVGFDHNRQVRRLRLLVDELDLRG